MFCCPPIKLLGPARDDLQPMDVELRREIEQHISSVRAIPDEDFKLAEALSKRLPDCIVDAHTHLASIEHIQKIPHWIRGHVISTALAWPIEDALAFTRSLFPDKQIQCVRFPVPIRGVDFNSATDYTRQACREHGDLFVTFGHQDRMAETKEELTLSECRGLKCYHRAYHPVASSIAQVFPDELLEVCDSLRKPIVLHLPNRARDLVAEVLDIATRYQQLPIVLAHCAMMEQLDSSNLEAVTRMAERPNVYCDTSMIMDVAVLGEMLRIFSPARVLFGSDQPLATYRALYALDAHGRYSLWPDRRYSWLNDEKPRPAGSASILYLKMIESLLQALNERRAGDLDIEAVFCRNAKRLFAAGA